MVLVTEKGKPEFEEICKNLVLKKPALNPSEKLTEAHMLLLDKLKREKRMLRK